jgi:hypothetical protein
MHAQFLSLYTNTSNKFLFELSPYFVRQGLNLGSEFNFLLDMGGFKGTLG